MTLRGNDLEQGNDLERDGFFRAVSGITEEVEHDRAWKSLIIQAGTRQECLKKRHTFPVLKKAGPFVYNLDLTYFPKIFVQLRDTRLCKHEEIQDKKELKNHKEKAMR